MTHGPLRVPYVVVDDFMPPKVALEMRATAEMHFGNPYRHSLKTHANWDYWYVPGLYTYLRTDPAKVLGVRLTATFRNRLSASISTVAGNLSITMPQTDASGTSTR
jgi:hypothetical protein